MRAGAMERMGAPQRRQLAAGRRTRAEVVCESFVTALVKRPKTITTVVKTS